MPQVSVHRTQNNSKGCWKIWNITDNNVTVSKQCTSLNAVNGGMITGFAVWFAPLRETTLLIRKLLLQGINSVQKLSDQITHILYIMCWYDNISVISLYFIFYTISPIDHLHPSPAIHFKSSKVFSKLRFQHHAKLWSKCSISLVHSLDFIPICW